MNEILAHSIGSIIPVSEWKSIVKVSVKVKDNVMLKILTLGSHAISRTYFAKIEFKDGSITYVPISNSEKDLLKKHLTAFNFHVGVIMK